MKKNMNGITLIALIITIIILLILAVVTIGSIKNSNIITYAQNASRDYNQEKIKEDIIIEGYESLIEENLPGAKGLSWTDNGDGTFSKGPLTVAIGDYVNYDEGSSTHTPDTAKGVGISKIGGNSGPGGYILSTTELTTEDLKWRVLGVNEKGEIELISADPTTQKLYLANDVGYLNAEENLNNFCNDLYGKGKNATGARSLKVEDIDKLTNYDKTTASGYGNKWTYKYPTDEEVSASTTGLTKNMWYRTDKPDGTQVTDWENITGSSYQEFRLPEETTLVDGENPGSRELEDTCYCHYDIASNLTTEGGFTSDEATAISNMIMRGTGSSVINQWLASRCVNCNYAHANFEVNNTGEFGKSFTHTGLFTSYGSNYFWTRRVRPVVSLKSDISFSGSGESVGSVDNMWQLS